MLRGERVYLRARQAADVPILDTELHDDMATRARSDARAWRPVTPGSAASRYAIRDPSQDTAIFSVVAADTDELAGDALLWGIDTHNRVAHIGVSLLPAWRGRGFGTDVVKVLCHYGFDVLGLHRMQIDTLADNAAMIGAAKAVGFVLEGTLRESAWVTGRFLDDVVLGLLITRWRAVD